MIRKRPRRPGSLFSTFSAKSVLLAQAVCHTAWVLPGSFAPQRLRQLSDLKLTFGRRLVVGRDTTGSRRLSQLIPAASGVAKPGFQRSQSLLRAYQLYNCLTRTVRVQLPAIGGNSPTRYLFVSIHAYKEHGRPPLYLRIHSPVRGTDRFSVRGDILIAASLARLTTNLRRPRK